LTSTEATTFCIWN